MRKNSHNTSDERYRRIEAKIQNAIDTILISGTVITKVTEFCVLAEINPATFYGHYESVGEAFLMRDKIAKRNLQKFLTGGRQEIEILYSRMFIYVKNHKNYFRSVLVRDNIGAFQILMETMKPTITSGWRYPHPTKIDRIYRMFTFEVTCEYNEWVRHEDFAAEKINGHIKRLVYLTDTACYRHGKYL